MSNQDKWKNRIVGEGFIPANQLKGNPHNWRTHGEQQRKTMDGVLDEIGWIQRVIVNKTTGNIVDGHLRAEQALIKNERVPVLYIELTEDEEMLALATIDPISAMAGKDQEMVNSVIDSIQTQDESILELIQSLIDEPIKKEGLTDPDDVPEIEENPISKLGDVWLMGDHRLMCGDSTSIDAVEKLMDGQKADMVFTDPPYGVDYDGGSKKQNKLIDDHVGTDIYTNSVPMMAMFCTGPIYTWYADTKPKGLYNAVEAVGDIHSLIIWKKNNSTFNMGINYKQKHEPCLYWKPKGTTLKWAGSSKEDTVWEIKREPRNDFHPTQKPVELACRAISNHSVGLILDLFGGSGSTLIACEKTNRNARLMELDPKYCDVIINRWQNFTGEKAIKEDGMLFDDLVNQHGD